MAALDAAGDPSMLGREQACQPTVRGDLGMFVGRKFARGARASRLS